MSIDTYSAFTYGHTITTDNNYINFNEGAGELSATVAIGSYSLSEFIDAISVALNSTGTLEYSVSIDRSTRLITITSTANFDLLVTSGSNASISAYSLIGYIGADLTGASSYEGDSSSGSYFEPQNILQSYVAFIDNVKTTNAAVNQSASGIVEVVSYGAVRFMECNIVPQTDITGQGSIKDDANGVANLRDFISYCITKAPIEFIPDIDTPSTFTKCLLESTRESKQGVDFKIKQFKKLFAYFQSGALVFRELE
jgi:hypothetical protein